MKCFIHSKTARGKAWIVLAGPDQVLGMLPPTQGTGWGTLTPPNVSGGADKQK